MGRTKSIDTEESTELEPQEVQEESQGVTEEISGDQESTNEVTDELQETQEITKESSNEDQPWDKADNAEIKEIEVTPSKILDINKSENYKLLNILKSKSEIFTDIYEALLVYKTMNYKIVLGNEIYPTYMKINYKGEIHYCISKSNSIKYKIHGRK
jgi:hypothetical protein